MNCIVFTFSELKKTVIVPKSGSSNLPIVFQKKYCVKKPKIVSNVHYIKRLQLACSV